MTITAGTLLGCAKDSSEVSSATEEGKTDWLGKEPEIKDSDIVETIDTDLVIVGAGNGGLLAAALAADAKMDFHIVEQNSFVCDTRNWYGVVNSSDCLAAGLSCDKGKMLRDLSRYSSGKNNQKVVKVWLDESAKMHDYVKAFMDSYGFDCYFEKDTGIETEYYAPAQQHNYIAREDSEYADVPRNKLFQMYIEEKGYAIDFNRGLEKLIKKDGKIVGIITGTDEEGKYVQYNAKNVILAAGGYEGNTDMMEALSPLAVKTTTACSYFPLNKGMGIKAALWAGASMDTESAPMIFDRGAVAPGVNAGYVTSENGTKSFPGTISQFNPGTQPFMKVNRDGLRFANESAPYNDIIFAAGNQKGGVYCQIMDGNHKADWQKFHLMGCASLTRVLPDMMEESLEKYVEDGIIMKADTLDELADKLGFEGKSKENFLAQCDRYNTYYDNGFDEEFYKDPERLSELRTAPFYGTWLGGSLLCTGDGIQINEKMQVLDTEKNVIEGLYAIGNNSGSVFANNYPELYPGMACGRTLTFAMKAINVITGND